MRVNCLNSLLNLADHGARILGLLLVGILTSSGLALAQTGSGNEAIYRDGRTPLFSGSSLDMSDLFRAAELLSRQRATSRWDSRAAIDAAVEQFNQSRRRPLLFSPGAGRSKTPLTR
ncbi:hypothetical protein [Synechococcus sp. O70.2]|uniref:hypothetical protein n=1 Tax=Synechococcus sp. O70.2 TaxID=2964533 RepID=UPI0039C128C6